MGVRNVHERERERDGEEDRVAEIEGEKMAFFFFLTEAMKKIIP